MWMRVCPQIHADKACLVCSLTLLLAERAAAVLESDILNLRGPESAAPMVAADYVEATSWVKDVSHLSAWTPWMLDTHSIMVAATNVHAMVELPFAST